VVDVAVLPGTFVVKVLLAAVRCLRFFGHRLLRLQVVVDTTRGSRAQAPIEGDQTPQGRKCQAACAIFLRSVSMALILLCQCGEVFEENWVEVSGQISFEAAHDFAV
jgi:hypothetical protein